MERSTRWLIGESIVIVVLLGILGFLRFPLIFSYDVHKTIHIVGAVLFLGNIIVTGAWMLFAERNGGQAVLHFAAKTTNWADVFFTAPGVFLLVSNGFIMATTWGGFGASWVVAALVLLSLSGIVWVIFLIPDQERLIRYSMPPEKGGDEALLLRTLHRWYFWGAVATVLPLMSLGLMVLKPRLW
ncbi:MAG: DUF2269 family protein [Nitrospinae bacterium]|nr:DUF2269 family protein [Nitrospinota bacterium]